MENRIIIAGNKYFPVSDINFDIVNFGYQDADPSHRQGPYFKSEHVLQYVLGGRGYYEIHGKRHTVKREICFIFRKTYSLPTTPTKTILTIITGSASTARLQKS